MRLLKAFLERSVIISLDFMKPVTARQWSCWKGKGVDRVPVSAKSRVE